MTFQYAETCEIRVYLSRQKMSSFLFQNLPWELLDVIFAAIGKILCWDRRYLPRQLQQINEKYSYCENF